MCVLESVVFVAVDLAIVFVMLVVVIVVAMLVRMCVPNAIEMFVQVQVGLVVIVVDAHHRPFRHRNRLPLQEHRRAGETCRHCNLPTIARGGG